MLATNVTKTVFITYHSLWSVLTTRQHAMLMAKMATNSACGHVRTVDGDQPLQQAIARLEVRPAVAAVRLDGRAAQAGVAPSVLGELPVLLEAPPLERQPFLVHAEAPGDGGTRLPLVPQGDELLVVDHGWFHDHDHMVTVQALHYLRLLSFVFGREVRRLGSPLPVNFTPYAVHRARLFLTSFATLRMSSAANWLTWTSVPTSRSASKALGLGPGQGRASPAAPARLRPPSVLPLDLDERSVVDRFAPADVAAARGRRRAVSSSRRRGAALSIPIHWPFAS